MYYLRVSRCEIPRLWPDPRRMPAPAVVTRPQPTGAAFQRTFSNGKHWTRTTASGYHRASYGASVLLSPQWACRIPTGYGAMTKSRLCSRGQLYVVAIAKINAAGSPFLLARSTLIVLLSPC